MITPRTVVKIGEFKKDGTNIVFESKKGRLNEAHVLLAFHDKVFRNVEGKRVRVTLIIEEIDPQNWNYHK
jgi:hypothetical protein